MNFAQRLQNLGLPLLGKELIEQAARKRTYVVRCLYASLLFFVAFLAFYETLRAGATSPLAVLGRGRDMFMWLVFLQFAGVYLFMPAITCGVITQEKERDSLQLLFLTRLGPWTIILEKLAGRLVPMFSFLLLSLPLLAFAYSLGGISPSLLWSGVWMLVLATIQMGTLAVMCSAFFRTTVGGFVATYVIAFILFFAPYVLWMMLWLVTYLLGIDAEHLLSGFQSQITPGLVMLGLFPFFGPPYFLALTVMPGGLGFWALLAHSTIILATSGVCLLLARKCLVSRAFLPPRNYLLEFLKIFDRREPRRSAVVAGRVVPIETDPTRLPADAPIAWRETTKRSLGRARYLFRILLLIEIPLLFFCGLLVVSSLPRHDYTMVPRTLISLAIVLMWLLAVLMIAVQAASLIAGERSRQTLDVLCTTPLTGRDIMLQKFSGVRRLILVLLVPFLTLFLCEIMLREINRHRGYWSTENFHALAYLACSLLTVCIYLPLVAWMSVAIGLKVRTQARAMIGSLGAIVAWGFAPYIFCVMPLSITFPGTGNEVVLLFTTLISPVTVIFWNEIDADFLGRAFGEFVWLPYVVNFAGYGFALLLFRTLALANADRWLGRTVGDEVIPTRPAGPFPTFRKWLGKLEQEGGPQAEAGSVRDAETDSRPVAQPGADESSGGAVSEGVSA